LFLIAISLFFEPAEEGGFIVKCFELPVATQGKQEEAIEGYLEVKAELLRGKTRGERAEVVVEAPSTLMV